MFFTTCSYLVSLELYSVIRWVIVLFSHITYRTFSALMSFNLHHLMMQTQVYMIINIHSVDITPISDRFWWFFLLQEDSSLFFLVQFFLFLRCCGSCSTPYLGILEVSLIDRGRQLFVFYQMFYWNLLFKLSI